jgi:hypothetical protein
MDSKVEVEWDPHTKATLFQDFSVSLFSEELQVGTVVEEVHLIKVHYMHVWKYHSEPILHN